MFVPLLVILETIWVLQSCYGVAYDDIAKALSQLLLMPVLKFEGQPVIQGLITFSHNAKCDLAGLLIAFSAKMSNCQSIMTFDKKAARFEYFELLTG